MELSAREIAEIVAAEVHGDPERTIRGVAGLDAGAADQIGFLVGKADAGALAKTGLGAVFVKEVPDEPVSATLLVVDDPNLAFAIIAGRFHPLPRAVETRIHPTAVVGDGVEFDGPVEVGAHCVIEDGVRIGAGTVIEALAFVGGNCVIGADCLIHAQAVLYHGVVLGDRVRIHGHAVIGCDGFGFAVDKGRYVRVPQVGTVVLEDDVEVGACACIDRATFDETRVRRGTKIDNLVHIAHNCEIGEDGALAAQVGLAGSTKVGARARFGGQVGIAGHVEIADDVSLGAKTGVPQSIGEPGYYLGIPSLPAKETLKIWALWRRLPELWRTRKGSRGE